MSGFIKKHYKTIILASLFAVLVLGGLGIGTENTFAAGDDAAKGGESQKESGWTAGFKAAIGALVIPIIYKILYIISYIAAIIFKFGGYLIDAVISLNTQILGSSMVTTGWTITRDFANLGFVLAIIYIAFATMLRVSSFELKKFLLRLVIMALLINFSLTIAGVFIKASDKVSAFFIEKISGEGSLADFAQVLAGPTIKEIAAGEKTEKEEESGIISAVKTGARVGLGVTTFGMSEIVGEALDAYKLLSAKNTDGNLDLGESALVMVGKVFFLTAFTVMSAIIFFAIGVMVLVRWLWLVVLLILAPFAWLAFAVPQLTKYFELWWDKFWKWTLYLPVVLFFLYLAMTATLSPNINSPTTPFFSTANLPGYQTTPIGNDFGSYGKIIIAIGLMVAGLIVGEKMSIAGAKTGLAAAKTTRDWAIGKVKGVATGVAMGAAGYALRNTLAGHQDKEGRTLGQRIAAGISTVPLLGTAAARGLDSISTRRPQEVDNSQKQYANMSDALLMSSAEQGLWRFSDPETAAVVRELAKRKKLGKLPTDRLMELAKKGKTYGAEKEVYKARPDLADNPLEIFKGLSPGQKAELAPDVYYESKKSNDPKKRALVLSLKEKDLREIAAKGSDEVIDAITATLKEAITMHAAGVGAGAFTPAEEASLKGVLKAIDDNIGLKSTFIF